MHLKSLEKLLRESWSKETCYPSCVNEWTSDNPALGQCAVTALVVQDYFGGDLLYCKHNHHYWNRLPNNREIDLTREQFPQGTTICLDGVGSRESVLHGEGSAQARTPERYELLKKYITQKNT